MDIKQELTFFQSELRALADPVRAAGEKRYLKSPFIFFGVRIPELRKLSHTWLHSHKDLSIDAICRLARTLWDTEYHELKTIAVMLLQYRAKQLTLSHLSVIDHMISTATGWDHIDEISARLCGTLYEKYPAEMKQAMHRWIKSNNFWVRRTALLTQLTPLREGRGDFALFSKLATPLLPEKEFFIRKAIGWVLRELSKVNPELVYTYVKQHKAEMSGLTYREATRKLPAHLDPH